MTTTLAVPQMPSVELHPYPGYGIAHSPPRSPGDTPKRDFDFPLNL